VNAEQTN